MIKFLGPFLVLLAACALAAAELPNAAQFYSKPELEMLKLSPNGTSLALRGVANGVEYLAVIDLKTMQPRPLGDFKDSQLLNYWWKGDDLLLLLVKGPNGNSSSFKLLDLKTGKVQTHRQLNNMGYDVMSTLPDDPDNVLVTVWIGASRYDLRKFNLRDGKVTTAHVCPSQGDTWILNHQGEPIAVLGNEDKKALLFWRKNPAMPWQRRELGSNTEPSLTVLAAHPDQRRLLAWQYNASGPARIVALDPETMATEVVFASPEVDPDAVENWGDNSPAARAITYETDRPHRHFLDASARDLMTTIDRSLPDTVNEIRTTSVDGKVMVVLAWNESHFGKYYLLDLRAGRLQLLGERFPELTGVRLSASRFFNFKSRDGSPRTGRYHPPAGTLPQPPLIVLTGPSITARAAYGGDVLAQLLASRGYAVARINHRGVRGFGGAFAAAGDKQLGTGMPDDLEDGVRWLIEHEHVDPKRIALYGRSEGGLVGLQAVLRSPLFSVWINVNTPMSSHELSGEDVLYSERDRDKILAKLGGKTALYDYLETVNPAGQLSRLRAPSFHYYFRNPRDNTLIAHGDTARKFFAQSSLPNVFVRGRPFSTPREFFFGTDARYREERIEIENQVLEFLARYFPVEPAK